MTRFLYSHEQLLNMMLANAKPEHRDRETGIVQFIVSLDNENQIEIVARPVAIPSDHTNQLGYQYEILGVTWGVEDRRGCSECGIIAFLPEPDEKDDWDVTMCRDCQDALVSEPVKVVEW